MNKWFVGGEARIWVARIVTGECQNPRHPNPRLSPLLFLLVLTACAWPGRTPPVATTAPVSTLQIEAPTQIQAGAPLTVLVHVTPVTATGPVLLTAQGTFGFLPQQQQPVNGVARFSFMLVQTRFAGVVHLRAVADRAERSAEIVIVPGPAVDPILPLVGPRAIVTGGEQWTMVVATPRDALDNPAAEKTAVTFQVQHPTGLTTGLPTGPTAALAADLETITTHTQKLLAWTRIYSRNRAGPMRIAVAADFGHSPERIVLATPGLPQPFQLHADKATVPADGRQLVRISSSQISDRFGNVLPDGTSVTLLATMSNQERRSLPAMTIDGRIYTTIQAPSQPGTMILQGWIAGVAGEALTLAFTPGPAVQPIRVVTNKTADGLQVIAGPLLGELGQFIPDGAAVSFTITTPAGETQATSAPTDYGYAQVLLRRRGLIDGVYQIRVTAGTGQGAATVPVTSAAWER